MMSTTNQPSRSSDPILSPVGSRTAEGPPPANQVDTFGVPATARTEVVYPTEAGGTAPLGVHPEASDLPGVGIVTVQAAATATEDRGEDEGTDGEKTIWVGRYSMRNFLGPLVFRIVLTAAWMVLAYYAWMVEHATRTWEVAAGLSGLVLAVLWLSLAARVVAQRLRYRYELTNRRLIVGYGVLGRSQVQLELIQIDNLTVLQPRLYDRWFNVGTIFVETTKKSIPDLELVGVAAPKELLDLIWHHTRIEQNRLNVRIDHV